MDIKTLQYSESIVNERIESFIEIHAGRLAEPNVKVVIDNLMLIKNDLNYAIGQQLIEDRSKKEFEDRKKTEVKTDAVEEKLDTIKEPTTETKPRGRGRQS